jgi:hypothetical protein
VSIAQRDYILRMIEQLGVFLAKIMGARKAGDFDLAEREVKAALGALFGPLAEMLEKVDSASAANLLGGPEKIGAAAALYAERAAVRQAAGNEAAARVDRRRALELYLEAARLKPPDTDEARGMLLDLLKDVDRERLPERYRRELDAIAPLKGA